MGSGLLYLEDDYGYHTAKKLVKSTISVGPDRFWFDKSTEPRIPVNVDPTSPEGWYCAASGKRLMSFGLGIGGSQG